MASIQRNVKTYGTRAFVSEVAAAPSNYAPILSNEVDADLDTVYAAWNGGMDSVNVKDGSITYAKLAPDAQMWRDTGTTLTLGPNFTTRPVVVLSGTLTLAPSALLMASSGLDVFANPFGAAGYDNTKTSWLTRVDCGNDFWSLLRAPAGTSNYVALLGVSGQGRLAVTTTPAGATDCLTLGTPGMTTTKAHFAVFAAGSTSWLSNASISGALDDASKPTWQINLGNADACAIYRAPPGSFTSVNELNIDSAGTLIIQGATAIKASGTTWANPSDRRLKDEIADYPTGLAAIVELQPRTFVYNGNGGSTAGMRGYGFIADEVAMAMPEMVGSYHYTREGADDTETDYETVDQSNLILALVNAVQELAARVATLEGAAV